MKTIYTVTVDGVQYQYPAGTSYQHIAKEFSQPIPMTSFWWRGTENYVNWESSSIATVR